MKQQLLFTILNRKNDDKQKFFRKKAGEPLSFHQFNTWFEKQAQRQQLVIECACFLREPQILEYAIWRTFSTQFIQFYKDRILSFFGFSPEELEVHRVPVNDHRLFLAVMLSLYRTGMFAGTQKELAEAVCKVFDLPIENSYVKQLLSGNVPEYEQVLDFFNDFRKYDF